MEPLSPRSTNAKIKPAMKDNIAVKAVQRNAMQKRQPEKHEKDLPGAPPSTIIQPRDRDGNGEIVYKAGDLLGKGGFAACYKGQPDSSSKLKEAVALKVVKSHMPDQRKAEKFRTELQIHSKMSHPNIVHFHQAFTFEEYTYLVLELCSNGSIMDMLRARRCLTLPEARRYLIQICGAVKYMHDRDVLHRDLKASNIFIDSNMNVKIGDLGLAAILVSEKDASAIRRTTLCGTPNYIAPEVLNKNAGHGAEVDIWSIGIIIFAMLDGGTPFSARDPQEVYRRIKARDYDWSEKYQTIPANAKDLVASILVEEDQRPSLDEIVSHDFFRSGWVPRATDLETTFLTKRPQWASLQTISDVSSQPGDWKDCCQTSGVGLCPRTGQSFSRIHRAPIVSIYQDLRYEAQINRTPTVPIKEGEVYGRLPEARPIKKSKIRVNLPPAEEDDVSKPSTLQQLQTRPSHGAILRDQARPRTIVPKLEPKVKPEDKPELAARLLRGTARRQLPLESVKERPVEASQSVAAQTAGSTATLKVRARRIGSGSSKSTRNLKTENKTDEKQLDVLESKDFNREEPKVEHRHRAERPNARAGDSRNENRPLKNSGETNGLQQASGTSRATRQPNASRKRSFDEHSKSSSEILPNTSLQDVLKAVAVLESNIGKAVDRRRLRVTSPQPTSTMPFVAQWLDYTRKFGIGYTLSDGTSGCVFSSDAISPSICVVVRDGEQHVKRKKDESYEDSHEYIPQQSGVPVEFLENNPKAGLVRTLVHPSIFKVFGVDEHGQRLMQPQTSQTDARQKRLARLWRSFASYMTKSIYDPEGEKSNTSSSMDQETSTSAVRFFQRFGEIIVHGFVDGSFQFNFLDHSKVVISADGLWCDFHCLASDVVEKMSDGYQATEEDFETRTIKSQPLADFFRQSKKKSWPHEIHQFEAKIRFVREVFSRWIASQTLGGGFIEDGTCTNFRFDGIREEPIAGATRHETWVTCGGLPTEQLRESTDSSDGIKDGPRR